MSQPDEFITTPETAKIVRKTVRGLAVERCRRLDTPPWYKLGNKILYKKSDVLAWLEAHRVDPRGEVAR
jgi:hypothetical protein